MWRSRPKISHSLLWVAAGWLSALTLFASEYHGQVTFNGLPVPGATVTAARDSKTFSTTTDAQGFYSFPDLTDGVWSVAIEMLGFATIEQDIIVEPDGPAGSFALKLLPIGQIKARIPQSQATQEKPTAPTP